jgi:hypothetical protein
MYRSIGQFIATGITVLLLSGGACYELPSTIENKDIKASDLVPSYDLSEFRESNSKCNLLLQRPKFNLKTDSLKGIELVAPATVTFQGKSLIKDNPPSKNGSKDGKKIANNNNTLIMPCENGIVEFVMTDRFGGERRDKVDLRKIKLRLPKIPIDRSKNLDIEVLNAPYPKETDFHIDIQDDGTSEGYHEDVASTGSSLDPTIPRPRFDPATHILTIPKQALQQIKSKQPIFTLELKTNLYYTYPDRHGSPWFRYNYRTSSQTLNLK